MRKRGLHMLEAHMRSFDPETPTARERLEAALGEPLTRQLLRSLLSSATSREAGPPSASSDGE
jgi:predicted dehydrogenase